MSAYPDNLPAYVPPPSAPAPAAAPAAQSTVDTLANRGQAIDSAVDSATGAAPIVRSPSNPANSLASSAFHSTPRGFVTNSKGQSVRNTPI